MKKHAQKFHPSAFLGFKGSETLDFFNVLSEQNLRGYHQLTLPYFCTIKDKNLVSFEGQKKKTSLFHKRHLKAHGGCDVFWTSPTSSQQPVLRWGTVTGHISHEVYGSTWSFATVARWSLRHNLYWKPFPIKAPTPGGKKKNVEDSVGVSKIYWSNLRIIFIQIGLLVGWNQQIVKMFKFQEVVVFFPVLPVFGNSFRVAGFGGLVVFFCQGSEGFGETLVGDVTCRNRFLSVNYATWLLMLLMMLGLCVQSMDKIHVG